jgi:hypothetical protein
LCKKPVIIGLEVQDEYLFAMRDCIANHERSYGGPFPPLGNENPALAMALAGVKGKKEGRSGWNAICCEIWRCRFSRAVPYDRSQNRQQ